MLLRVFRWLSVLPLGLLQSLGAALGLLVYAASSVYRQRLRANMQQAGYAPEQLARKAAAQTGRMVGELPVVWFRRGATAPVHRVQVIGKEHVDAVRAQGMGVLYLTPHLGCFEISAQAAALWSPITVMFRPPRKAVLLPLALASRQRHNLATAPANLAGVRQLLRALRAGESVGLLPDQAPGSGEGVWADFFGRPAYTMTLPARLVQLGNARIILASALRLPGGRGYTLTLEPFPEALDADPQRAATQINRALEGLIRRCPEQYLWAYNRYKIPSGAPPPPAPNLAEESAP
ncbi:MAG: lipid A biosynthesis acyltransferase [Thiomonas sp. 14-64-326]|uniref:Lipid A biosynthesis acyltransferase n=1 Tax=Thiomonas intermedia (strain K12) TaxID=75379 RepID=D5X3Z0_THIK1|nr:lysophospholipid acyltransferase family protein [Thiomonas sp.]OZB74465.1 MAG: lipid A biosynthesis acyltransferase [Thiomonas sp. 14-64-326]